MSSLLRDLRYALRRFRAEPLISATVVATLTIAFAACTAIFSVVNGALLRPLPYPEPAALVAIGHRSRASASGTMLVSVPGFRDYARRTQSFSGVAIEREVGMNMTGSGPAERIAALRVSGDWFAVYQTPAQLGRSLGPDDQLPGHDKVVVLTDAAWRRDFGASRAIVGQSLLLNDESYRIVGVMPPGFRSFFRRRAEIFIPAAFTSAQFNGTYSSVGYYLTARLRPGVSVLRAASEVRALGERLKVERAADLPAGFWLSLRTLDDLATADLKPGLVVLVGASLFLLLIACANIANLFLARDAVRMREVALRTAIGASGASLMRQLLAESVVLSLAGIVPGVLLARIALRALLTVNPDLIRVGEVGLDMRVLGFAVMMAIATGLLFGALPALQWSSLDLSRALREGGRSGTQGRVGRRLLDALVIGEVALALMLLVGAGLVLKTMSRLEAVDPGFDARHTISFKLSLPALKYPSDTAQRQFVRQLDERLATIPGIRGVGITSTIPFGGGMWTASILPEGRVIPPGQELPNGDLRIVSPGFFAAMRIKILSGRAFTEADDQGRPPVAIIDELFARRMFDGQSPLGRRVALDPQPGQADSAWITIVGVVAHTAHDGLDAAQRIQYYFPYAQRPIRDVVVAIGTAGDPTSVLPRARAVVGQLDADLPLASVATLDALVDSSLAQRRLLVVLLAAFSLIAVVLASVGIYGLISYSVARRSRELGIRRALGGSKRRLLLVVLGQGMTLTGCGVAAGVVLGSMVMRLLASQLYLVTPTDPATFAAGATLLIAVAMIAILVPAIRATRADPLSAMRAE